MHMHMYMWVMISLAVVLVLKAYTSREIGKLLSRIYESRKALREVKEKRPAVAQRLAAVKHDQERMQFRVGQMKEVLDDLKIRLESAERDWPTVEGTPSGQDVAANV